jgi:hypothetical protein
MTVDLHVRGEIPDLLDGSLLVACSRRNKDRSFFSRWHDSQADLIRLELTAGKPGKVRAQLLSVDSSGADVGLKVKPSRNSQDEFTKRYRYATQPNHGLNVAGDTLWATNLLFGAPLEVDLKRWKARRVLRYFEPDEDRPQVSSTSHFAWSLDHRYAYFHQSLLKREMRGEMVKAEALSLIELDTATDRERIWRVIPPREDPALETANFHSAFFYREAGRNFVGLLRTGALLETLEPHRRPREHKVCPLPFSAIWIIEIDHTKSTLQASVLPGIDALKGIAMSHLEINASSGDGFVLFANYKQADVAEETHGVNVYGERPGDVCEHYSGMMTEAMTAGIVFRYERKKGKANLRSIAQVYDPAQTGLGHTWMPINLQLDSTGRRLFGSFLGVRPRLLSRHVTTSYPDLRADYSRLRYVPPLLMRYKADTLEPDWDSNRRHMSYAEPVAMAVIGDGHKDFVCTFSPELGLRVYSANDLSIMLANAVSAELGTWNDTHFRPDPAHMVFVRR